MDLGNQLTRQRKKHDYTQLKLSLELDVTQQVISNYERNVTIPTIDFLKAVADLYLISIDELIGRKSFFIVKNELERKILSIIEEMDTAEKELSLRILHQVAECRGGNNEK